jgi:hypothetical protein
LIFSRFSGCADKFGEICWGGLVAEVCGGAACFYTWFWGLPERKAPMSVFKKS